MNTSSKTQYFLERNTQGLMLLSEQRYKEAVRTFRSLLGDLHTMLGSEAPKPEKRVFYKLVAVDIKSTKCASQCPMALYTKGFLIEPTVNKHTEDVKLYEDAHLLSSVVLYNLAICVHLRAKTKSEFRQTNTKMALILYRTLETFFRAMTPAEQDYTLLLQLAVFNNTANVHMEHYDIDLFENSVRRMQSILHSVIDRDLEFFCLNLFLADPLSCFSVAPCA
jgi:hypothetical protein